MQATETVTKRCTECSQQCVSYCCSQIHLGDVQLSGLAVADYDDAHFMSVRDKGIHKMRSEFVRHTIDVFGVSHCMMESNFPVDKLMCSWTDLYRAYANVLEGAGFTEEEKDQLFRRNAVSYYDLDM